MTEGREQFEREIKRSASDSPWKTEVKTNVEKIREAKEDKSEDDPELQKMFREIDRTLDTLLTHIREAKFLREKDRNDMLQSVALRIAGELARFSLNLQSAMNQAQAIRNNTLINMRKIAGIVEEGKIAYEFEEGLFRLSFISPKEVEEWKRALERNPEEESLANLRREFKAAQDHYEAERQAERVKREGKEKTEKPFVSQTGEDIAIHKKRMEGHGTGQFGNP